MLEGVPEVLEKALETVEAVLEVLEEVWELVVHRLLTSLLGLHYWR